MKYHLTETCGNTFILFDCLQRKSVDTSFLKHVHTCLKAENRDDALILLDQKKEGDELWVKMLVLGLDGELAQFCGNGACAAAAYLFRKGSKNIWLETEAGKHKLSQQDGRFSVSIPFTKGMGKTKFVQGHYVEVGEPHLVFQNNLSDEELFSLGRGLNAQKELFPFGINVNAWHILDGKKIHVKTYERGVQRLTLACGSGSIACASIYQGHGTVEVATPGGNLTVTFREGEAELAASSIGDWHE